MKKSSTLKVLLFRPRKVHDKEDAKEEERPHEQLDEDLNNELDQYVDELNICLQEKESKAEELQKAKIEKALGERKLLQGGQEQSKKNAEQKPAKNREQLFAQKLLKY